MPKARPAVRVRRSWRTPDARWTQIAPLLPRGKPHPLGCHNPRVVDRRAVDAIFLKQSVNYAGSLHLACA